MPVQLFVDDSGGKGHSRHFVLAGLVSNSERWQTFCNEWNACLAESPPISLFKMREAATLTGAFRRFSEEARDDRLRKLARVIDDHVEFAIWTAIDLEAHADTWSKLGKPSSEPYFWCLHTLVLGVCFDLWETCNWREKFEAHFDEQLIFGDRAAKWLPFITEMMQHAHPAEASLLPDEILFCRDDDHPQIQAADLWAWCIRRNTDKPEERAFEWLLLEMKNVSQSNYCNYYDLDRMTAVVDKSRRIADSGEVPPELIPLYRQIAAKKRRGG